jgi:sugar/nucleoside kinase (ribokinase family)
VTPQAEERADGPIVVVGDVINDVIVAPRTAVTADSDTVARIEQHPGGSAANVAAWLGHVGSPVRFFGRVGAADAEVHRAALADAGVEARLTVDDALHTGTIVVLLDEAGHRTMFTDRGANAALRAADVPAGAVETAAILHISGYALVEPSARGAALELIGRARTAGVPVALDPNSVAFIGDVGVAEFRAMIADADILVPNLDEGRLLTGRQDPHDVAADLATTHRVVALTLGKDGVLVSEQGGPSVHLPALPAGEVDPTGAGDAFCAGILHALRAGRTVIDAAREGTAVAAEAVATMGARPSRVSRPADPIPGGDR